MTPKVLIAGASGAVGAAAVDAFLSEGWDLVALSRRRPATRHPPAGASTLPARGVA